MRKSNRGATIWEYALGGGLVAGALIGVAAFILPSALNVSFVSTMNATQSNDQVVAQSFGTPTDPVAALNGFQTAQIQTIVDQMSVTCVQASQVCFPSFPESLPKNPNTSGGLGETSGGLGQQQYLDTATNYVMTAVTDLMGRKDLPESLKERFRELATRSQELAAAQQQLAEALRRGDAAQARQLVQRINGGSQVYISDRCMAGAICIDAGDGVFYNIIPANDPLSLIGQIALIRQEIAADENVSRIQNATLALDSVFGALEDRARRLAVLVEGDPPVVETYNQVDIQDFIATLTSNVSYLSSLVSSMNQEKNAEKAITELANSLRENSNYEAYGADQLQATVDGLVRSIQEKLLADPTFSRGLTRGAPDMKEATRLTMKGFAEYFSKSSGNSREIAEKLRDDVLGDTESGRALMQAALENATAAQTMEKLLATITGTTEGGRESQEMYQSVVRILSTNPEITTDLQKMATSGRIDPGRVEEASRFLAEQMSENTRQGLGTEALETHAQNMLKAAEMSCSAGKGKFNGGKCVG